MPRSKKVSAYPQQFFAIIQKVMAEGSFLWDTGEQLLAQSQRRKFYAFTNALESEDHIEANNARGLEVSCGDLHGGEFIAMGVRKCRYIRFTFRDGSPEMQDLDSQLGGLTVDAAVEHPSTEEQGELDLPDPVEPAEEQGADAALASLGYNT